MMDGGRAGTMQTLPLRLSPLSLSQMTLGMKNYFLGRGGTSLGGGRVVGTLE